MFGLKLNIDAKPRNYLWEEKYKNLTEEYKSLEEQLVKVRAANKNLKETIELFLDHTRQQEWVLPQPIICRLPRNESLMLRAALQKVPYGKSPAEYAVNILFFLSLTKAEQLRLGAKLFHLENVVRPENYARLQNVAGELLEFIYLFTDDDMYIEPESPYLIRCVPKRSTNPRSKWMDVKNRATNFFPIYTTVTVVKESSNLSWEAYCNESSSTFFLEAQRLTLDMWQASDTQTYRIETTYDARTGRFKLKKDNLHSWEIANYGVCTYNADFHVSNLVMDNNPPYTEGMKGIVQIMWTGRLIYQSIED